MCIRDRWSPISAFVDGVKMGSGSFEEFTRPSGSSMPQTVPSRLYLSLIHI